jgi:photosystem II stability/assembly factor-like uncharacterized protein
MRKLLPTLLVAGLILCAPRNDRWEIIGPGGGGSQFYPTVSPHDPKRVLIACDMTGSYLTEDGGASWRMFNLGGTTRFFAWDPNNAKVIYAGSNALYRSADGGRSWNLLFPAAAQVTRVEMIDDSAFGALIVNGGQTPRASALAIDPARSDRLYAAFGRALRISEDTGATWRAERDFPNPIRHIWAAPDALYVTSDRTLDIREKGVWRETVPAPAPWVDIAVASPVLYAVSGNSGAVSEDAGKSWRTFELPGIGARFHAIATSLHHPDTAYLSYDSLRLDGQIWFGVAKTTDRGRTWRLVWKEGDQAAPNVHDAWLTPRFGPGWSGRPLYLGVAPADPDICYATDMGRTMRTSDGGKTWEAVYSRRTGQAWTSTGLDVTTSYGVHFDPFDLHRIFITYTDIGAFRSEDGGRTWVSSTDGVPDEWVNTTYWMEFDPKVRGRVWAAASWTHDLPRPKMWRDGAVSTYRGGVIRSEDGGRTWRKSNTGIPETAATHILLDPQSPESARTLYVAAFGRGVYKSVDGGGTWTLKNRGIAGDEPFAWRLSRAANGGIYLVVARRSEDGRIGDGADGALYFSADAAEHWARVQLPEGVNGPNGLAVDPGDPKRLLLAAWRLRVRGPEGSGGVYLSPDAGATWKHVLRGDQHIYDVSVDPRDSRTWYACGFESSAWRSTDRGETWQRIRGFNFKWGHRVIPDPSNPSLIYITTFGGSVWHGPAAGDPNAIEDLLRP